MKNLIKSVIGFFALVGIVFAVMTVHAQSGPVGANGMGVGRMGHGMMQQGWVMGQASDMKIIRELFTPAERLEMMDQMMDAKTFEERQSIMVKNQTEVEKRAKEKGIQLPFEHHFEFMHHRHCG
jgi:hypothetical protein